LLWHVADAVEVLKPKFLLQENVAALVSEKFLPDFQKWLKKLDSLGYINRWALINAKDHGVPQNRLRVFCVSMRKDMAFDFRFPESVPLNCTLEDKLEDEVAERFFLKDDAVMKFLKTNDGDDSVFLRFDEPPTHEAAMFLKTYLQLLIADIDGWNLQPVPLFRKIALHRYNMGDEWAKVLASVDGFGTLYAYNLARQKNAPDMEPTPEMRASFHEKTAKYGG
jgi:DNA (cytosine-5)-methyltransferase 1